MANQFSVFSDTGGVFTARSGKDAVVPSKAITKAAAAASASASNTAVQPSRSNVRAIQSRIFAPFRALGYVTSDIPVLVQPRGITHSIISSIGNSFQIFDGEHLRLQFVGGHIPSPITSVAAYRDVTFAAAGSSIYVFKRAKPVARLCVQTDFLSNDEGTTHKTPPTLLSVLIFGDLLLSHGSDNALYLWNRATGEKYSQFQFEHDFTVTKVIHPSTYVNKILVGSRQGSLKLINIRTMRVIYEFDNMKSLMEGKAIVSMEQTPALDVIAIGLSDGSILLVNIKYDQLVMKMKQDSAVTCFSFRLESTTLQQQQPSKKKDDKEKSHHIMATGGTNGDICLWDLSRKQLRYIMKGAHNRAVHTATFYETQPILVTAGSDNAIRQWIFDSADGSPRLLRSRSGHYKPPTAVQYYDAEGNYLLSAGSDRSVRLVSVIRDSQNVELSQGSIERSAKLLNMKTEELKIPPVLGIDVNSQRERDWDNILTCSLKSNEARTWSMKTKALGKHVLRASDDSSITAVSITACGNFGIIGTSTGLVERFNMQSGELRKTYKGKESTSMPIVSIHVDACNKVIVSTSLDSQLRLWRFSSGELIDTMKMDSPIARSHLHRDTNLLALAMDDLTLNVIDIETFRLVRQFSGHDARISDLVFSPDARLLVSASVDCIIKTWDLPTGQLVDIFKVSSVPTSIAFSPNGSYLATCHSDHVGIFLWANRLQFENIGLKRVDEADIEEIEEQVESLAIDDKDREMVDSDESDQENINGDMNREGLDIKSSKPTVRNVLQVQSLPTAMGTDVLPEFEIDSLGFAERAMFNSDFDRLEGLLDEEKMILGINSNSSADTDDDEGYDFETANHGTVKTDEKPVSVSCKVPRKWYNVLHLDDIKQNNKSEEEDTAKETPFFLQSTQSLGGAEPTDSTTKDGGSSSVMESKILRGHKAEVTDKNAPTGALGNNGAVAMFNELLSRGATEGDYTAWIQHVVEDMGPASIDLAVRTLPCADAALPEFVRLVEAVEWCVLTRNSFDAAQTVLAVFLTIHADVIAENMDVMGPVLDRVYDAQLRTWPSLDELFQDTFCMLDYSRGMVN